MLRSDNRTCSPLQVLDGVVAAAVDDAGGEDEILLTEQRALEPQNASELQLGLLQVRFSSLIRGQRGILARVNARTRVSGSFICRRKWSSKRS